MTIDTGVLEFTSAAAMGSGPIVFASGFNGTLRIDGAVMPKATIKGFAIGNTIDLAGVAYSSSGTATLESGNLLQVSENGKTYDLQLDPSASYSADTFDPSSDGDDGVDISLSKALSTPVWIPPARLVCGQDHRHPHRRIDYHRQFHQYGEDSIMSGPTDRSA